MPRSLVWIERQNFEGFGCSECNWEFQSFGPFLGNSLEKMKESYQDERDKEFAAHTCAKYPKGTSSKKLEDCQ
jgi:hypothetical protein